jgi:tRNA (guanine37-N1)-methyltransferase
VRVDVLTIFPDYLAPLDLSLPGRARRAGLLDLRVHDLRQWTHDRHRTVDDTPAGGGPGMVMRPEPWGEALDELAADGALLLVPTPSGQPLTQALVRELAAEPWLVVACGRYEGIDQRVVDHAATRMRVLEVSLGDYVLNGGEVAALVLVEAVSRLLPGVLGNPRSLVEESHEEGLLEYPVYTKPAVWRGLAVPGVLRSGDHAAVAAWRHEEALRRTARRRPDLLSPAALAEGQIGLATHADAGELLTLQWACWGPPLRESLADMLASIQTGTTFVLRSAGRLVGSVRCAFDAEDGAWEIGRLMVAPDLRGRGLGRALLERAEQAAPGEASSYRLVVGADNERAVRMYRRAGYAARPGGTVRGVLVMSRPRRRGSRRD